VVPLPGDGTGDLRVAAEALGAAVTEALGRTGADSVDVIGYSAGGLVARLWAADGGADVARRVLTLGSPHHGTSLAALADNRIPERCPVSCQQMVPESELLAELNAGDETPEGPDWISIWTTQDAVVTPTESARLDSRCAPPRGWSTASSRGTRWCRRWWWSSSPPTSRSNWTTTTARGSGAERPQSSAMSRQQAARTIVTGVITIRSRRLREIAFRAMPRMK
jgi:pimeloyl-ACP methyl ester carboxylesterase